MLARINGCYAEIERTPEGKLIVFRFSLNESVALACGTSNAFYNSLSDLKNAGYKLLPLTLETLSTGDQVKHKEERIFTIGSASGYGKCRCYVLIYESGSASSSYTSKDLESLSYVPVQWEEYKRTPADVLAGLSKEDQEILTPGVPFALLVRQG